MDTTDRYEMPTITEEAIYAVPTYITDGDVYRNYLYYGLYQTRGVWAMDITTGEVSLFSDAVEEPGLFSTDTSGLYVWDKATNEIVVFDYEGAITQRIPMPDENRGELYFWQIDHYDGLLAVAARENVWTLEDGKAKWQEVDVSRYLFECIMNVRVRNKNSVVIVFRGQYDESSSLVIECDRKGRHAKVVIDESVQTIDITGGHLYMANGLARIFEVTDKGKLFKMKPEPHPDLPIVQKVFISNQTMLILWDAEKEGVAVYPFVDESKIVRIVAPRSEQYRLRRIMDIATDVSIQYTLLEDETFFTQLSAKQLARDRDFDLALISGTGEEIAAYLPGVLRGGQFYNLRYSSALSENLAEAYPAISEIVTHVDHYTHESQMFALPLSFSETFWGYRAEDMGSIAPPYDWSAKDLWTLTEKAKEKGFAVFDVATGITEKDILLELMKSQTLVEIDPVTGMNDNAMDGNGTKAVVSSAFEKILSEFRLHQSNLVGNSGLIRIVGRRVFSAEQVLIRAQSEYNLQLFPSADSIAEKYTGRGKIPAVEAWAAALDNRREKDGMQVIDLTSFFLVNPNGANASGACDLLAELTNEDNRYNASIYGSPLFPHLDQYYVENDVPGAFGEKVRRSIIMDQTKAYIELLDGRMAEYYEGSTLNLITVTDRAKEVIHDFCAGNLTPEEAAEILYQELVYTLKG